MRFVDEPYARAPIDKVEYPSAVPTRVKSKKRDDESVHE